MDCSKAGIGHRIYEVRRALGPDARHEMPQRRFADLLNERARAIFLNEEERPTYDSSVIARLERGERWATVQDLSVVAAVDPERRSKLWLGWDEPERGTVTDEEIAQLRAERDAAVAEAERLRVAAGGPKRPKHQPKPK